MHVIRADSHPYLADHAINGTPVLPVAMVLEWFSAGVSSWYGPLESLTLHKIDLLRKATLHGFRGTGDRFSVRCTVGDTVSMTIVGDRDVPHYRAFVAPSTTRRPEWKLRTTNPRPVDYEGSVLFHGPAFHALHRIDGITSAGAAGEVIGARRLGWPGGEWQTDPAAIDGGLQLAGLWVAEVVGCRSLPMSVGEFRLHRAGLLTEPLRCVVRHRETDDAFACFDIGFLDADGDPRIELVDARFVLDPSR